MDLIKLVSSDVLVAVAAGYTLRPMGVHGLPHWARVAEIGGRLAPVTGANPRVVAAFAVLHDSRRINDHRDPGHGARGAELAASLGAAALDLSEPDFELLQYACIHHTDGLTEADVTVQTCWDADRLDLSRVGITPRADRLCTEPARAQDILDWAIGRAQRHVIPEIVVLEWERIFLGARG